MIQHLQHMVWLYCGHSGVRRALPQEQPWKPATWKIPLRPAILLQENLTPTPIFLKAVPFQFDPDFLSSLPEASRICQNWAGKSIVRITAVGGRQGVIVPG